MERNEFKERILVAESAIENAKEAITSGNDCFSVTLSAIEFAIMNVKPLLKYENDGIHTITPAPSEWIKFLKQKQYEIQDPDHLYDNVKFAQGVSSFDKEYLDDTESELTKVIEKCKTSNNAHDKLALAIIYKNLGENHSEATELLKSYIDGNYSNPFYTKMQMLFMLAELYKNGNNPAEAINTYTRLLKIAPANASIYIELIETLNEIGRYDLAAKALTATKNTTYYKESAPFKYMIDNIMTKHCLLCKTEKVRNEFLVCDSCKSKFDLSSDESDFIEDFLQNSYTKVSSKDRLIYMSSSSECVLGNCRRFLNNFILSVYNNSREPLDILAVATTYARMHAAERPSAIKYWELFLESPTDLPPITNLFGAKLYLKWHLYSTFANIYEAEYQFDKAIQMLKKCIEVDAGTNSSDYIRIGDVYVKIDTKSAEEYYLKTIEDENVTEDVRNRCKAALADVREKIQRGYVYRPRRAKQ